MKMPTLDDMLTALEREYAALRRARRRWESSGDPADRQAAAEHALRCAVLGAAVGRASYELYRRSERVERAPTWDA